MICTTCDGTGEDDDGVNDATPCPDCAGTGEVTYYKDALTFEEAAGVGHEKGDDGDRHDGRLAL